MELKPGYKRTEVGVIPEDWVVRPLLSAVRIANGQVNPRCEPFRSMTLVAPDHIESGSGRLLKRVTAGDQHAISGKYRFDAGDIVYSKIRPYLRKVICAGFDGLCSADMYPLKPASDISAGFVLAVILDDKFSRYAESVSVRSGMPKINRIEMAAYSLPFPHTKAEQEAIAEALSDADALIESLDQLIAKKRDLKQGVMQELLTGKKRLPGYSMTAEYKSTDLGSVPGDWDVVAMGSVSDCLIGLTYSPLDVREFGTLVLRSSNVQDCQLRFDDNVYVEMEIPQRAITREGDILVCVRNGSRQLIGKCALIDKSTAGSAFGAFMSVLRSDSAQFLLFQFQSDIVKRQINEVMGATINQITNKDLATFRVIWPSTSAERTAIATILSDMDGELAELQSRLAKARQIKQGMMQELLTGRIRLL